MVATDNAGKRVDLDHQHQRPGRQHHAHGGDHRSAVRREREGYGGHRHVGLGRHGSGRAQRHPPALTRGRGHLDDVAAADTAAPFAAIWSTTGVPDGLYDLRVVTTDKAATRSPPRSSRASGSTTPCHRCRSSSPAVRRARPSPRPGSTSRSNAAGSFGLVATVTDAGSGAASASFPLMATAGWTHTAETDTTPTGGPYSVGQFRVDQRCVSAGHLHRHGGRRRGEYRHERVHVHGGSDRADRCDHRASRGGERTAVR